MLHPTVFYKNRSQPERGHSLVFMVLLLRLFFSVPSEVIPASSPKDHVSPLSTQAKMWGRYSPLNSGGLNTRQVRKGRNAPS